MFFSFIMNRFNRSTILASLFIIGNHDCNVHLKNEEDNFAELLQFVRDTKNVHYLSKTGAYVFENIVFGVTNVKDLSIFKASDIDSAIIKNIEHDSDIIFKVALYHGTLNKAKTENFTFNDENMYVNARDFDGFDFTMLGDIHKQQFMNKLKTIAYSGSLLQQNHGESLKDHGYLVWNMKRPILKNSVEFVRVENDYGFYTVDMNETSIKKIKTLDLPKKTRIRIITHGQPKTEIAMFRKTLIATKKVIEITEKKYIQRISNVPSTGTEEDISNKSDKQTQSQSNNALTPEALIKAMVDLLKKRGVSDEKNISAIIKIFKESNGFMNFSTNQKSIGGGHQWKIEELKFISMFNYDDELNMIVFTAGMKDKISGIIAGNGMGKTSVLDVLLYCIFGNCSRGGKRKDVMNKCKDSFQCSVIFSINGNRYKIEKTAGISKASGKNVGVVATVSIMNKTAGEWDQIAGTTETSIKTTVESLVGTYENFLTTTICLQDQGNKDSKNIIGMTAGNKSDFLIDLFGLNCLGDCRDEAKKKLSALNKDLAVLSGKIEVLLEEYTLDAIRGELKKLKNDKIALENNIAKLKKDKKDVSRPAIDKNLVKYGLNKSSTLKFIESIIGKQNEKILVYKNENDDSIETIIENLNDSRNKLNYESNLKLYEKKSIQYTNELFKLNNECIPSLPRKIPKDEIERLKKLKMERSELIDKLAKLYATEKIYDIFIDNKLDGTKLDKLIMKVRDDISFRKGKLEDVKIEKMPNDKLIEKREKLKKNLLKPIKNIPLDEKEKATAEIKIKLKNNFKKIQESDVSILEESEKSKEIRKMIKRKKQWISDYKKERENLKESLDISTDDFNKQTESQKKLEEINKQIKLNKATNKECTKNKAIKSEMDNLKKDLGLLEKIKFFSDEKLDMCEKINELNIRHKKISDNAPILEKIDSIKDKKSLIDEKIENLNKKYKEYTDDIVYYKSEYTNIEELKSDLSLMKTYRNDFNKFIVGSESNNKCDVELEDKNKNLSNVQYDINKYSDIIEKVVALEKNQNELEIKRGHYSKYHDILDPKVLPHYLLKTYLPIVIEDANDFLSSFSSFELGYSFIKNTNKTQNITEGKAVTAGRGKGRPKKVVDITDDTMIDKIKKGKPMKIDNKVKKQIPANEYVDNVIKSNSIELTIKRKIEGKNGSDKFINLDISNGCGYEKFISNIALRYAFRNVSNSIKSNFFIIDEGWSCLDENNSEQIHESLKRILEQYNHVIIISHLPHIKNLIEYPLYITKTPAGLSNINNTVDRRKKKIAIKCVNNLDEIVEI